MKHFLFHFESLGFIGLFSVHSLFSCSLQIHYCFTFFLLSKRKFE